MPDLRKKIFLESGKTVSRKARSRPESTRGSPGNSPVTSRNGSRATSRANSRYGSEEEDLTESEYDDSVASSIINSDDGEDVVAATWPDRLHFRMEALIDRKRSSAKGRESTLTAYTHIIRHHYAAEYVESRFSELIPALLKSIRSSSNTDETLAALKALAMTVLSIQSETVYGHVYSTLKGVCDDSEEASIKVGAIEAMCITTMCGGGSLAEAEELMEYLLEIIESDGHSIGAGDNGSVVSAALAGWGFVATNLEDLYDQSELALDAFTEQLDSTDVDVQIAAGTNIALIFEAAREHEEETEEPWNVHYDHHKLLQRMIALAKESSKSISKKNRKHLHASFNSVLTSLELGKGPGYSTARRMGNPHTGGNKSDMSQDYKEFGYREKIRLHNISMVIDSWSLSARLEMLKHIVGGGLADQYMENPTIKDLLSTAQVEFVSAPKGKRNDTSKNGRGKQTSRGKNSDDTDY
ncbi:interferon-related developmental regulator-domain-containing protein [Biscogniauxia mediterranea]|nr:interferon-related developmental regulator-domain-containing protein [Biscogniauxia mediterranea]